MKRIQDLKLLGFNVIVQWECKLNMSLKKKKHKHEINNDEDDLYTFLDIFA
jgi:G:T-mismatch repair DNA endonuclease (very short patch repair protein)